MDGSNNTWVHDIPEPAGTTLKSHFFWTLVFLRDGGQPSTSAGNKRLQQTQAQVNEVVGIMRVNVEKVLERDQKLSELDQRVSNNNINLSGSSPINHLLSIDIPGGRPPARSLTVRTAGWQVKEETVVGER